jgi:phosphopantothenate-cysteine ligase
VSELVSQLTEILTTEKIDAVIHLMAVSDYTVDTLTTKSSVADNISTFLKQHEQISEADPDAVSLQMVEKAFSQEQSIASEKKISSDIDDLIIVMKKTPKVIGLIKKLQPATLLVGFKLLSNVDLNTLIDTGHKLLLKNNCDRVLANDLWQIKDSSHRGYLISPDKTYERFETKEQIASGIVKSVASLLAKA